MIILGLKEVDKMRIFFCLSIPVQSQTDELKICVI